jgi:16S rRNA (cytosine1402-N4)-methyltransferase
MSKYHTPVMLQQCINFIAPKPGGIYVDATIGGGGNSLGFTSELSRHPFNRF